MREGSGTSLCCAKGGRDVGGRRVAEYEEFDEGSEKYYDGELAKKKALCEGEAGGVRIAGTEGEYTYEDSIFGASAAIFVFRYGIASARTVYLARLWIEASSIVLCGWSTWNCHEYFSKIKRDSRLKDVICRGPALCRSSDEISKQHRLYTFSIDTLILDSLVSHLMSKCISSNI